MTELTIKSVEWKRVEVSATKKQFDEGLCQYALKMHVECEIPKGFEVFRNSNPDVFIVRNGKIIMLYMEGYHIGNNILMFSSSDKFNDKFELKIYMA